MNEEFVVQSNGQVRQAGATDADGAFVHTFKLRAERSLYVFERGVLNYTFLTPELHRPVLQWLQRVPPVRKMLLMARDHGKSTMTCRGMPQHMWVQPADANVYFPGQPGTNTRILMAGETESRAQDNLRVVKASLESNDLLRALWPHVVWSNPRRDARVWNDSAIIIPRATEFAEPSLRAIGVGGAITGQHPNVIFKDDITTEEASNSETVMQTAIDWHVNTRALFSNPGTDLEFITATYWAVHDLPHIVERDPSVAVNRRFRAIVEGGAILWPEKFKREDVDQLMREFGPRFYLLYMNSVVDSNLVDFDKSDLRFFEVVGDKLTFTEDERDLEISGAMTAPKTAAASTIDLRGRKLHDPDVVEQLRMRAWRPRAA